MNRLADETSPYLRQHADNPVDWYPWGPEAFAAAREHDKPILLSVGYSACHWCHVMAHESFEDEATAALMNDLFVNIKVDREERPDVDAIYMDAVQGITGHGGWPMTVFMTPRGEPFFGGTYYPNEARGGMPSFADVMRQVRNAWDDRRDDVVAQAAEITASLGRTSDLRPETGMPDAVLLDRAAAVLRQQYDAAWGGFGRAPKFPNSMSLDALLRVYLRNRDDDILHLVTNSLDAMASGGIYDHLGGGFSRYSVDAQWIVPHFEKMLYDNALLVRVYLHAWQLTGKERFRQVFSETIDYLLRDLRQPEGGFYSAEDADSEGEEGKFYVWTADQIESVLGDDAGEFMSWYGVSADGNYEGKNILFRPVRGDLIRPAGVELSRHRLFTARELRVRPGLDDKVLSEWNGLMLASLAEAAAATGNHRWLAAARRNGAFLAANLRRPDGRWLRSWQAGLDGQGHARHLGYAADYAALIDGFTRLSEATGEKRWIDVARSTADGLLELFWDTERGGVYTNGNDAETLVTRPKDITDNAVPSANSSAALALYRLAALTAEEAYRDAADDILRLLGSVAGSHPMAFGHLLAAIDFSVAGPTEVVVPGERSPLVDAVQSRWLPNAVLAWGEPFESPLWEGREDGRAYVCHNYTCAAPVDQPEEVLELLRV